MRSTSTLILAAEFLSTSAPSLPAMWSLRIQKRSNACYCAKTTQWWVLLALISLLCSSICMHSHPRHWRWRTIQWNSPNCSWWHGNRRGCLWTWGPFACGNPWSCSLTMLLGFYLLILITHHSDPMLLATLDCSVICWQCGLAAFAEVFIGDLRGSAGKGEIRVAAPIDGKGGLVTSTSGF